MIQSEKSPESSDHRTLLERLDRLLEKTESSLDSDPPASTEYRNQLLQELTLIRTLMMKFALHEDGAGLSDTRGTVPRPMHGNDRVRILILEDNLSDVELMKRELRKTGTEFEVAAVHEKHSFLESLDTFTPDLILMDYSLPGFDGLTALELTRQRLPDIPVIIVSGAIGEEFAIDTLKAGATDYVLKQRLSRLAHTVDRAFKESRQRALKRRAEDELRASAEQYRQLADSMPQLVWSALPDGTIDYFNNKHQSYRGISRFPDGTWNWQGMIHPEDRDSTAAAFSRALQTGKMFQTEHRMQMADGSYRWHLTRGNPVVDSEGKIRKWYGTATDIHEQKSAEQELRFNQEWFHAAARLAKITISVLDTSHRYLWLFNPHEDFPGDRLIGKGDDEVFSPPVALELRSAQEETIRTGKAVHSELRLPLSDGIHDFDLIMEPWKDNLGVVRGVIISSIDVTEKKQLEESLRRAKAEAERKAQELDAAITSAAEAIIISDPDGSIRKINAVAEELMGYEKGEPLLPFAERVQRVRFMTPDGILLSPEKTPLGRALHGELVRSFELLFRRRGDGTPVYISGMAAPIRDSNGTLLGAITAYRDISEQKRIEEELRLAKTQAETANKAKTEFLAHMSHEFRTPLGGIIGMSELLLARLGDSEYGRYLSLVRDSAQSLLGIIGDVLDLSQIESGKIDITEHEFYLSAFISSCIEPFEFMIEQQGLSLSFEIDENLSGLFLGDSDKIAQVLRNFLSNAVKYTDRGSIRVAVREKQRTDDFVEVLFSVKDTGMGIPPEKQEYIFHEFTRIVPENGRQVVGTGLGLAISKRLIHLMGGELCLDSEIGKGSTFYFMIPLRNVQTSSESLAYEEPTSPVPADHPRKILLAEDTLVNKLFLETVLREAGHTVTSVENGLEAVNAVMKEQYDLVLMDIQMPEMDGLEATRRIRTLDRSWNSLPIVALTAYAMRGDRERILEAGIDEYLTKPVDVPLLKKVIERIVWDRKKAG